MDPEQYEIPYKEVERLEEELKQYSLPPSDWRRAHLPQAFHRLLLEIVTYPPPHESSLINFFKEAPGFLMEPAVGRYLTEVEITEEEIEAVPHTDASIEEIVDFMVLKVKFHIGNLKSQGFPFTYEAYAQTLSNCFVHLNPNESLARAMLRSFFNPSPALKYAQVDDLLFQVGQLTYLHRFVRDGPRRIELPLSYEQLRIAVDDNEDIAYSSGHKFMRWMPPYPGCYKLNVDGSRLDNGSVGCGGVIRDGSGNWILGFVANLGVRREGVLYAEAMSLFYGLKTCKLLDLRYVEVETDSQMLNVHVNAGTTGQEFGDLAFDCRRLLLSFPYSTLQHISRENNYVADELAGMSHRHVRGLTFIATVPDDILQIVDDDMEGVIRFRRS